MLDKFERSRQDVKRRCFHLNRNVRHFIKNISAIYKI